jgi:hypothetical protein
VSVPGGSVQVCHGIDMGLRAGLGAFSCGLELEAQGLGGSGFVMRESGPVSSVGAKAQL